MEVKAIGEQCDQPRDREAPTPLGGGGKEVAGNPQQKLEQGI
jgi:hypothetical protein